MTLEIDKSIKFGPDAEWVDDPYDYSVNENLKSKFCNSINRYLPDISEDMLSPSYAGIRPITSKEDRTKRDFTISTFENHKIENLINLYGIEGAAFATLISASVGFLIHFYFSSKHLKLPFSFLIPFCFIIMILILNILMVA